MSALREINIGAALFGLTRREVLALFYTNPERSLYLRQVTRSLGLGQGCVQRELARLSAGGLLTRRRVGSQVHYQANGASPVFSELKTLMIKSAGVADVLRQALSPLVEKVEVAFIYGSMARGGGGSQSDVDLMVIGTASFREVVSAIQPAQRKIGREVNPSVYTAEEFGRKLRSKHQFIKTVAEAAKIFLIGTEHELERLAKSPVADAA